MFQVRERNSQRMRNSIEFEEKTKNDDQQGDLQLQVYYFFKKTITYDIRPPRNATGLPPISLIFRWHESNKPDVVGGAVGPIMCPGDRNILTRLLKRSIVVIVFCGIYFCSVFTFFFVVVVVKIPLNKKIFLCAIFIIFSLPFFTYLAQEIMFLCWLPLETQIVFFLCANRKKIWLFFGK